MDCWGSEQRRQFAVLCRCGCTREEVRATLMVADEDLDALVDASIVQDIPGASHPLDFDGACAFFAAQGRAMLRTKQFELARDGDRPMLTWLGRQALGQDDSGTPHKAEGASSPTGTGALQSMRAGARLLRGNAEGD